MATVDVALLVLRMGVGLIFAVHGAQKLFGAWGGPGMTGWTAAMDHMGYRPARLFAWVSAIAEFAGGLLLALGLLTPIVATVLIAQSIVIVGAVHWRSGFFNRNNGFEFPLALATGFLAVLLAGPGGLSIDGVLGLVVPPVALVGLLVTAIAGGLAMLAVPALVAHAPNGSEGSPRTR